MTDALLRIVFRYDDLSADPAGERDADEVRRELWRAEQAVDGLFRRHAMPWVVGVVPDIDADDAWDRGCRRARGRIPLSADPEKCAFLVRGAAEGSIEVAMHGFAHTNHAPARAAAAEFRRDRASQAADIAAGRAELRAALAGTPVTAFIPPFNGWNGDTAEALLANGFGLVSADRRNCDAAMSRLAVVPFTAQLTEIEEMLDRATLPASGLIVVIFHPPQIARMPGAESRYFGPERLERMLARLAAMPSVAVRTLSGLEKDGCDVSFARYQAACDVTWHQAFWHRLLPARLRRHAGATMYLGAEEYRRQRAAGRVALAAAGIGAVVLAASARYVLARIAPAIAVHAADAVVLLCAIGMLLHAVDVARRGFTACATRTLPLLAALGWLSLGAALAIG